MVSVRKLSLRVGQANAASSKTAAADEHGPRGAAPDRILEHARLHAYRIAATPSST